MSDVQLDERIGFATLALSGLLGGGLLVFIDVAVMGDAGPRSLDGALYGVAPRAPDERPKDACHA